MADQLAVAGRYDLSSMLRQAGVLVGVAASVAIGVAVALWSTTPSYSLLHGDLSDLDVSQIIDILQNADIEFRVDHESGAVLVRANQLQEAKLKLASAGLPKSTSVGFEMLEKDQNFGVSQFIEQARYQRALEGELGRSIAKLGSVKNARVHLAIQKQSVFTRDKKEPTASVILELYPGRVLDEGQVAAISHLVSASVPNLTKNGVTVIDQQGRLLNHPHEDDGIAESTRRLEYSRRLEELYTKRIEDILIPLVGMDGVKAQVAAEMDFTDTEKTSEVYDPDAPAVRSEQVSQEKRIGKADSGVPGALSNQPPGETSVPETTGGQRTDPAKPPASPSEQPKSERTHETRNYGLDRTISHSRLPIGAIRKLSAAVIVNNKLTTDKAGKEVRSEYSAEELARITALVKEAIGFNVERGDSVNVISANFAPSISVEELPEPPIWEQPWFMDLGKQIVGLLFAGFIVFGVIKPVLKNLLKRDLTSAKRPNASDAAGSSLMSPDGRSTNAGVMEGADPNTPKKPLVLALDEDSDVTAVKTFVQQDPKLAAQVIKGWLGNEQ